MKFREFHINIKIRVIENFVSRFLSSMILPFMTIYLAMHYGAKVAGGLLMINVCIGIMVNLISGYVSDQYGRKKILLFSELLRMFAFITMALCNSPWFQSVNITFLMMIINTICWGLSGPINSAMLIDVSKPEQRKQIYTITYWGTNLAIAIGGILGAFLFNEYLFELFIMLAFGSVFTVVLVVFFIQESYFPEKNKKISSHFNNMVNTYCEVFKDRLFILFSFAVILLQSTELQLTNYISVRLSENFITSRVFSWEVDGIHILGILRTENTILVLLCSVLALRLSKKIKNEKLLLLGGSFLFVIGYGLISYMNNIWWLLLAMMLATIGEVVRVPIEQSNLASMPPKHARSSYMAVSSLSFNVASLISALTLIISELFSPLISSITIAFVGFIAIAIYNTIFHKIGLRVMQDKQLVNY